MPSGSLTGAEMRRIYQIIGECRELGDDLVQWRSHLWLQTAELVDADLMLHAVIDDKPDEPNMRNGAAWGFENGFNLKGWVTLLQEYGSSLKSEMTELMLPRIRKEQRGNASTRQMLIADRDWHATFDKRVMADTLGTSATIQSYHWLRYDRNSFDAMTITRGVNRREFTEREAFLVGMLHSEITSMIGNALIGYEEPQPSVLAPRVRQVLACMLEGDSDKQIAIRLGISPHTVNQYTKVIFQHFTVCTRTELLARWIRRGWTVNASAWEVQADAMFY